MHQQQWRDWESGKRKPGKENQTILAKFFGITLSELRGEAPPAGAGAPIAPGVDEAEQRRMAEAMCEVAFIRYHLDVVQGYVLRGELSADAYLELTDSVLAAIQSTLAAHGKTLRTADPFAE